jgi:hypothetical protein
MQMRNDSDSTVKWEGQEIAPGAVIEVEDCWCRPRRHTPSVISMAAPQLVPVSQEALQALLGAEPPVPETSPTVKSLMAAGVPEGIAEQQVAAGTIVVPDELPKDESKAKGKKGGK